MNMVNKRLPHRAPRFVQSDRVYLRSDRSRVGTIAAEGVLSGEDYWYRVEFVDGRRAHVCELDLDPFVRSLSPEDLFVESAFGDRDDLLRVVTYHKLSTPIENTLYSLGASRTDFYPHQYKPLIKMLDSKDQRLLIADEVGLGKTIEAGLILTELRARRALNQALVVCPSALCEKWRDEMWNRFDEEFSILGSAELQSLIRTLQDRGTIGQLRAIISLQTVRQEYNIEMLETTPLPLDYVIIDEAHHLRNSETLSHRACAVICEGASAVVLLTATPIQIGNRNLFNLFRVLDPQEFDDYASFEERLAANEPVVAAERVLRASFPPDLDEVRKLIGNLNIGRAAKYFAKNPYFRRLESELSRSGDITRSRVAQLHADVKDLNLLSHIFTRTRKRDVLEASAKRVARVVRPQPTDQELRFYNAVTAFVRGVHQLSGSTVPLFAAISAQRQVASSVQAAKRRFINKALDHMGAWEEGELDELVLKGDKGQSSRLPAEVIAAAKALDNVDTKFDALVKELARLEEVEPGRKLIIFSYFRDTLEYLQERLATLGYAPVVIHGDVKSDPQNPDKDERGQRLRKFRSDPLTRILISSEVGSEGLDFQFCHILVNYDLPWNPMRVEQRIGRLDRIGQESNKVIIVNMSLQNTIEDRILDRLYARIGIFEQSIGDLESIIGDEIHALTRELLARELTPEEEEELIDRAAAVIEGKRIWLERLDEQSGRLVGRDIYFEEQLDRARQGGEVLAPVDLRAFTTRFLAQAYPRTRLLGSDTEGVYQLQVDPSLETSLRTLPMTPTLVKCLQRLGRSGSLLLTFDASKALDDDIELVAAHHPLSRLAVRHFGDNPHEIHAVSAVRVSQVAGIAPGVYLFVLSEIVVRSGRVRKRLEALMLSADTGEPVDDAVGSLLLGQMLRSGRKWEDPPLLDSGAARTALEAAEAAFLDRLSQRRSDMVARNAAIVQTRLASLQTSHDTRLRRKQDLLDRARSQGRQERYIRMLEGTIRNMIAQYEDRRDELEMERAVHLESTVIGCGLVQVEDSV